MPSQAIAEENSAPGVAATPVPTAPWRVKSVAVMPGFRLAATFMDDRKGVIDCSGIVAATRAGIYTALADEKFFAQARIELGAITWPNGADLDPVWSYDELAGRESWSVPF